MQFRTRDVTQLGYRRIVLLLVALVIVPTGLLTAVGTFLLVLGEARMNLVMGILVLCFTGAVVTGSVLVWVFVRGVDHDDSIVPGQPVIHAAHDALVDAVVNLLSNAYKYGGEPRHIGVSASASDGRVRIAVKDNGGGIPHAEHKHIFQKFYRVDDRLARQKEGSGLGLAIVEHIVRAHGGRVELESELGKGSTFSLVLSTELPTAALGGEHSPSKSTVGA